VRARLGAMVACVLAAAVSGCGSDDDGVKPQNTSPTASFVVTPEFGTVQTVFQFDASGSTDAEDSTSALEVRWDWENDGTWDEPVSGYATTKSASHQYATAGMKTTTLELKDSGGLTGTATRTVTVDPAPPPGFVLVQPGTFTMGSPSGELCRWSNETQHQVTLTRAFYVATTEVTQAQWLATMGWDDSYSDGPNLPIEQMTWFDAVSYCNLRSAADGLTPAYAITGAAYDGNHITSATVAWIPDANGHRLLTEAEWEYACRAGSASAFCNGGIGQCDLECESDPNLDAVGWYCGSSGGQTHDVGTKSPNAWGIHDMHGNVWEWCWDWYGSYGGAVTDPAGPASGSNRVARSGSAYLDAQYSRSALRNSSPPGSRDYDLGLRLARTAL
jgi:formylglycine-generating enzyme required for sulfatase activity